MKKPTSRKSPVPRNAVVTHRSTPHIPGLDDYELPDHIDIDYSKAKPNRFAARFKYSQNPPKKRTVVRPSVPEPLERHTIMLYRSQVKALRSIDTSLSRAIRKVLDAKPLSGTQKQTRK